MIIFSNFGSRANILKGWQRILPYFFSPVQLMGMFECKKGPVNVLGIARSLGIVLMLGDSMRVSVSDNGFVVCLSKHQSLKRQCFSLALALGRVLSPIRRDTVFALDLLLPRAWVLEDLQGEWSVGILSEIYQVDRIVVISQLRNMGVVR